MFNLHIVIEPVERTTNSDVPGFCDNVAVGGTEHRARSNEQQSGHERASIQTNDALQELAFVTFAVILGTERHDCTEQ
jgi:hypothetical protein